jgi:hypothetical protein
MRKYLSLFAWIPAFVIGSVKEYFMGPETMDGTRGGRLNGQELRDRKGISA